MNLERPLGSPKNDDITGKAELSNVNAEVIQGLDFSQCLNIEELYALTDRMEKEGRTITGTNGNVFDASAIRSTIAEVRKARSQNLEGMAIAILVKMTNQHGVRKAISRIVQGDAFVNLRETLKKNGRYLSSTNLDIHI